MAPAAALVPMDPKINAKFSLFRSIKWEHLLAGVSGGVISTLILHPLDLVKIRFQVNEGPSVAAQRPQYHGVMNALVTIGRKEGIKGLYRGVTPNVWGAGASWGLYFLFYNSFKSRKIESQVQEVKIPLTAGQHMLAAAQAGVVTLTLTNPIWVAKTRLCLQYDSVGTPAAGSAATHYRGMADCLYKITKYEGIRGLYKGFIPGIVGVSHGALQFMAYEELKKAYSKYCGFPADTKFNTAEYLTFAALSKIFAASATYPYQVVRSRLQDQHRVYTGVMDVLRQTVRYEGFRGFYKGLVPYLLHVTPNICMVFLIYEHVTTHPWFKEQRHAEVTATAAAVRADTAAAVDTTELAPAEQLQQAETAAVPVHTAVPLHADTAAVIHIDTAAVANIGTAAAALTASAVPVVLDTAEATRIKKGQIDS